MMDQAEATPLYPVDGRGYNTSSPDLSKYDPVLTSPDEPVVMVDDEEETDEEDDTYIPGKCDKPIADAQKAVCSFFNKYEHILTYIFCAILIVGFLVYFGFAVYSDYSSPDALTLICVTCVTVALVTLKQIVTKLQPGIRENILDPISVFVRKHETVISVLAIITVILSVVIFILVDIAIKHPENLVSLAGYFLLVFLCFIFSTNPARVRWRVVWAGLTLQFIFALIVLRTEAGYKAMVWLGDIVIAYIENVKAGASFVFGELYVNHPFAMETLSMIIYLSATISILYHWGVLQVIISKFGWLMRQVVGTTAGESTSAAANVFLSMTDIPLLIAPLLDKMTRSELHTTITSGFSTIAGSVLGAYILMGIPANQLITASVMACPCCLAVSKLLLPETKKSKFTESEDIKFDIEQYINTFDAICRGAMKSISIIANIAVNLIAFLSLLSMLDELLGWLGERVGMEQDGLSFELICSYVFWPLAYVMGVQAEDCNKVAEVIGLKVFTNEFYAYTELSGLIKNRGELANHIASDGDWRYVSGDVVLYNNTLGNVTLDGGVISPRSETILTFALCSFANFGSIGIQLGIIASIAPKKSKQVSEIVLRAMIAGQIVTFLNASVAGLLYEPAILGAV